MVLRNKSLLALSLVLGACQAPNPAGMSANQNRNDTKKMNSLALVDATAAIKRNPRAKNRSGVDADPINIAVAGDKSQLMKAFAKVGWVIPDARSIVNDSRLAAAVAGNYSYSAAPVSDLFLYGRPQDLVFEQQAGNSPRSRHHVRFWQADQTASDGSPIWLGAATFDNGVTLSTVGIPHTTHSIAPNIDEERQLIGDELSNAGVVQESGYNSGGLSSLVGLTNAEGDPIYTDGKVLAIDLTKNS